MTNLTPSVENPRRPRAAWYLLALAPFAVASLIAALLGLRLYGQIKDMPRVVVPGQADIALDAGDYTGFLESSSVVDGVAYQAASWSGSCNIASATGTVVSLETSSSSTSYSFGSYAGKSAFGFTVPVDGTYHVACTGSEPSAVLAIGHGIGVSIVVMIVAMFAGIIGAVVVLVMVRRRRRRR